MEWIEKVIFPTIRRFPDLLPFYSFWIVTGEQTGVVMAEFLFKGINENMVVEIGYHTEEQFKNCGLMTWVVGQMIVVAKDLGIRELTAFTERENKASRSVLRKNGFKMQSMINDLIKYSLCPG